MTVTANITVSFGDQVIADGADAHLSAEIDDRPAGLNGGNTSFAPGDTAYFLVFASSNVAYDVEHSAGTIASAGTAFTVTRELDIQFADADRGALPVPATAITGVTWLGRSLGSLTLQDPKTVKASAKGVAVARVTYTARADAYGLTSPATLAGLTDFSILVYILGRILP